MVGVQLKGEMKGGVEQEKGWGGEAGEQTGKGGGVKKQIGSGKLLHP